MSKAEQKHPDEALVASLVGSGRKTPTPRQLRRHAKAWRRWTKRHTDH